MNKKSKVFMLTAALSLSCALSSFAGWNQDEKGWYWYQYDDGSYAKSGIKNIDGVNYAFDASGYMLTGWQYLEFKWYYFYPGNGAQAIGWTQIDGKWYYLDPDKGGEMATYWLDLGKDRYYLDEKGVLQTGIFYLSNSTDGATNAYQADANGVLYRNSSVSSGDKTVRYGSDGIMMYRSPVTKKVAEITGEDEWQYLLNEEGMRKQEAEFAKILGKAAEPIKDELVSNYNSTVRSQYSSSKRAEKKTAWEKRARKKLNGYLTESEIEQFISDVEAGRSTSNSYTADDYDYEYDDYD